jgi:enoyl-CoA hydratase/carnithine racemase
MPETGLGMVPGWSGTQRLVRRFGAQVVRRMVLGGEVFSGVEALALGLVDDVVDTGHALEAAMTYANAVAERGPAAVQTAKLMIAAASGEAPEMAIDTIASILAAKTADLREGVDAFSNKRPAAFKGEW